MQTSSCKLGAGGSSAPAKLATWFDFRAGDRAHLWSTEAGRPAISPLARPTGALPRADWAASRVLSAGGHSPPSSSTAAARPPSSGALPARRLRTTTQSPCLCLCVSRPTDLDRACSIQRLARTQGWTVFQIPSTPGRRFVPSSPGRAVASRSAAASACQSGTTSHVL